MVVLRSGVPRILNGGRHEPFTYYAHQTQDVDNPALLVQCYHSLRVAAYSGVYLGLGTLRADGVVHRMASRCSE